MEELIADFNEQLADETGLSRDDLKKHPDFMPIDEAKCSSVEELLQREADDDRIPEPDRADFNSEEMEQLREEICELEAISQPLETIDSRHVPVCFCEANYWWAENPLITFDAVQRTIEDAMEQTIKHSKPWELEFEFDGANIKERAFETINQ